MGDQLTDGAVLAVSTLLLLSAAVGTIVVSGAAGESSFPNTMPHDAVNNYSIHPSSHQPGAENVDVFSEHTVRSLEGGPENEVWIDVTELYRPVPADCQVSDLETLGIDRNNTYRGTKQYDDDQIQGIKETQSTYDVKDEYDQRHNSEPLSSNEDWDYVMKSYVDWAEPDHPQPAIYFSNNDRFVVSQTECFTNPEQPGWYRWVTYSTVEYDDGSRNDPVEPRFSHWYYICDCDSREDAVETLGPPPSQEGSDDGEDTPTETDSGGEDTATEADGGEDSTPSGADGPGFGVAAALVGLLALAMLAARR